MTNKFFLLHIKNPPHFTNTSHFQLCFLLKKLFENKIANNNNIICAFIPSILNPTISIIHFINSLRIFTIPPVYEVYDILMTFYCTYPNDPHTYLIISHNVTLIFSYFLGFYCELTKL